MPRKGLRSDLVQNSRVSDLIAILLRPSLALSNVQASLAGDLVRQTGQAMTSFGPIKKFLPHTLALGINWRL